MGQSTSCFSANNPAVPGAVNTTVAPKSTASVRKNRAKHQSCVSETRTAKTQNNREGETPISPCSPTIVDIASPAGGALPPSLPKATKMTSANVSVEDITSPSEVMQNEPNSLNPSSSGFSFPTFSPQITHSTSQMSQVSASTDFTTTGSTLSPVPKPPKRKEVVRKKLIGGGVTGKIYSGTFGDVDCVIKSVTKKNSRARGLFSREYKALNTLKHDNIVRVHGRSRDEENYYLILEKANIDLADYRMYHTMKESQVRKVVRKLFEALKFMHSKGYVHRDIKPENIVFRKGDETNPVLIDFGEALDTTKASVFRNDLVGTPNYLSKERLLFDELAPEQFEKADIFAVGVVCFELLAGVHCFNGATNEDTYRSIILNKWEWPESNDYHKPSPLCKQFVKMCLTPNYLARPNVDEILSHPWLNSD